MKANSGSIVLLGLAFNFGLTRMIICKGGKKMATEGTFNTGLIIDHEEYLNKGRLFTAIFRVISNQCAVCRKPVQTHIAIDSWREYRSGDEKLGTFVVIPVHAAFAIPTDQLTYCNPAPDSRFYLLHFRYGDINIVQQAKNGLNCTTNILNGVLAHWNKTGVALYVDCRNAELGEKPAHVASADNCYHPKCFADIATISDKLRHDPLIGRVTDLDSGHTYNIDQQYKVSLPEPDPEMDIEVRKFGPDGTASAYVRKHEHTLDCGTNVAVCKHGVLISGPSLGFFKWNVRVVDIEAYREVRVEKRVVLEICKKLKIRCEADMGTVRVLPSNPGRLFINGKEVTG